MFLFYFFLCLVNEVFSQNLSLCLDSDIHIRACLPINGMVTTAKLVCGKGWRVMATLSSPPFLVCNWSGPCQSPGTHLWSSSCRKGQGKGSIHKAKGKEFGEQNKASRGGEHAKAGDWGLWSMRRERLSNGQ